MSSGYIKFEKNFSVSPTKLLWWEPRIPFLWAWMLSGVFSLTITFYSYTKSPLRCPFSLLFFLDHIYQEFHGCKNINVEYHFQVFYVCLIKQQVLIGAYKLCMKFSFLVISIHTKREIAGMLGICQKREERSVLLRIWSEKQNSQVWYRIRCLL